MAVECGTLLLRFFEFSLGAARIEPVANFVALSMNTVILSMKAATKFATNSEMGTSGTGSRIASCSARICNVGPLWFL